MSFNIGENVGPYRITEQLGKGGLATVYKSERQRANPVRSILNILPAELDALDWLRESI